MKSRLSTIYYPVPYNFEKAPNWKEKCTRLLWPVDPKKVPTAQKKWRTLRIIEKHVNLKHKKFHSLKIF